MYRTKRWGMFQPHCGSLWLWSLAEHHPGVLGPLLYFRSCSPCRLPCTSEYYAHQSWSLATLLLGDILSFTLDSIFSSSSVLLTRFGAVVNYLPYSTSNLAFWWRNCEQQCHQWIGFQEAYFDFLKPPPNPFLCLVWLSKVKSLPCSISWPGTTA